MNRYKLSFLLATLGIATGSTTAQETIFSTSQSASPRINDDHSVTFTLPLKADATVTIDGSFLSSPQQMTRDSIEGSYHFTTEPLEPEYYFYRYFVDGMPAIDPSNMFTTRDITTIMNWFVVGSDIPQSRGYIYSPHSTTPHGSIHQLWIPSQATGKPRRTSVYLPAGFDANRSDQRYPVLYLLHGSGGDETAWLQLGRASQILDNLIADGSVEPMIVVMPNGNIDRQAEPGVADFIRPDFQQGRWMDGSFEEIFPEIVAWIDHHYPTQPSADRRAVAGLSMGGFNAMNLSRIYPDTFGYVGLFSAAMLDRANGDSQVFSDEDARLRTQMSGPMKLYWIGIGSDDFLYDSNTAYRQKLDRLGFPYIYRESAGGHQWSNWRDYLREFLQLLFKAN